MRKNNFIGKDIKSDEIKAILFNKIIRKLQSYQNTKIASIYLLKKINKLVKAKKAALIKNDYEVFCGFSKKSKNNLKRLYKHNKLRWNHYFNQNINMIDCFADIRMHSYFCLNSIKKKYYKNILIIRLSLKKDYDDGFIFLKDVKDIDYLESILSYIWNCFKALPITSQKVSAVKSSFHNYPIRKCEVKYNIKSRFVINNKIILLEINKICNILNIKDSKKISYTPYRYHYDNPLDENEILKMRNNKFVFFDLLFKYNNHKKWFRVEGVYSNIDEGNAIFDGNFIDISIFKRNKLTINLKRIAHKHIPIVKNEISFKYMLKNDRFICFGDIFGNKITKIPHTLFQFHEFLKILSIKNEDGKDKLKSLLSGMEVEPFELHIASDNVDDIYYEVDGIIIYSNQKPRIVIGKFINITNRKLKEIELTYISQFDKVSNFYTYESGKKLIKSIINNNRGGSLVLIDIDDFHIINEEYGKMFGNIVIKEVSKLIKDIFLDDILIRYYGDGFIAFLDSTSIEVAKTKANMLLSVARGIYYDEDYLSISVGIVDTEVSYDVDKLINTAEQTLLYAQHSGGDIVYTYKDIDDNVRNNLLLMKGSIVTNAINTDSNIDDIIALTLEILSKAKNFKAGLKVLLNYLKEVYSFHRISIYEYNYSNSEMSLYCNCSGFDEHPGENESFNVSNKEVELIINSIKENEFKKNPNILNKLSDRVNLAISRYSGYRNIVFHYSHKTNIKYFITYGIPLYKQFWNLKEKRDMKVIANIIMTFLMKEHDRSMVQVKSDYLSNMSHEIRTPLNGIIGMTKIAKNVVDDTDRISDALAKIDMSSRYLLSLVNNILDLARIESNKMKITKEPFLMNDLFDDIETLMNVQADQKYIKFQVIRKFSNCQIIGDVLRISQVLVNLLGNAFKFTEEYGHVVFLAEETISINDTSNIRFVIKDSGIGIKKENTLKIFESFEQGSEGTTRRYGGSGLGLSISYKLVKLMGGTLEVKSEEGKGSEFFFTLSFNHDKRDKLNNNSALDKNEEFIPSIAFIGKRILLVEDDELNAEIIRVLLDNVGFKVETTQNGKEAIELYAKSSLNYYDIILMDIRMPVMDGHEATTLIRSLGRLDSPLIPIIAMTANAFEEDVSEAIKCGMNGYITKPIDIINLYQVLEKILDNK